MASHFDLRIYQLQPNAGLGDSDLSQLIGRIPAKSILLIEDIDRAFPVVVKSGDKPQPGGPTMSGILNILDGLSAGKGLITFITTNNRQNIDQALLRPGRISCEFELGYATKEMAENLFKHFYSVGTSKTVEEIEALAVKFSDRLPDNSTMAELTNFLGLRMNTRDPEAAVEDLAERLLAERLSRNGGAEVKSQ